MEKAAAELNAIGRFNGCKVQFSADDLAQIETNNDENGGEGKQKLVLSTILAAFQYSEFIRFGIYLPTPNWPHIHL